MALSLLLTVNLNFGECVPHDIAHLQSCQILSNRVSSGTVSDCSLYICDGSECNQKHKEEQDDDEEEEHCPESSVNGE